MKPAVVSKSPKRSAGAGRRRSPASQCSISRHRKPIGVATEFKIGAQIRWLFYALKRPKPDIKPRGKIGGMSLKSRLRAAFAFGNAPRPWGAMATLTYPSNPPNWKDGIRKIGRVLRTRFGTDLQWGWIMEWQRRGAIHFHVFLEEPALAKMGAFKPQNMVTFIRHGKSTEILRGELEHLIVGSWVRHLGECDQRTLDFQWGGIVEKFRTPDAAARYVAKEAGKRCQKALPAGVEGAGRWWFLSKAGQPVPGAKTMIYDFPTKKVLSRIFDKAKLDQVSPKPDNTQCFPSPKQPSRSFTPDPFSSSATGTRKSKAVSVTIPETPADSPNGGSTQPRIRGWMFATSRKPSSWIFCGKIGAKQV